MRINILYFAAVRHRIGINEENAVPPPGVITVGDLKHWLQKRGEPYKGALSLKAVRAAVGGKLVEETQKLKDGDEVALFPPASGG